MIYRNKTQVKVPELDILTLIFESPHCLANEDTPVFAEAHDPENVITKRRARQLTRQLSHFLRNTYSIGSQGPGKDVVVTVSSGQRALPCMFYSVIAAEGIYSAASPSSTAEDIKRQIEDGPAKVVVCSGDVKELVAKGARAAGLSDRNVLVLESSPEIKLTSIDGSVACDFKGEMAWRTITDHDELENSKVCLLYSSGTTGLPKGVLLSHENLVSETYIPSTINRPVYDEWERQGKPFVKRTLGHLPAAHIAGVLSYFAIQFLDGGVVYWMPKFNFDDFLRYAESLRISNFFSVPPIYLAIAKHPAVKDQFRYIRHVTSGAAPMSAGLQSDASRKLAGVTITQVWGLSETTGSVTHTPPGRTDTVGSVSPLLPNIQMRLVDEDDKDVEPGQSGEALLKGPMITKGYHNRPEANKSSFTSDGWFRTGDVLKVENDMVFVVDRKKELIKYKGLQVAPAELEGILESHPSVADAAVIGVERDDTEVPKAFIVLVPQARGKYTEKDFEDYVKSKVSDYKRLRGGVKFMDAVPRSPSGKILRKDLRAMEKRKAKL